MLITLKHGDPIPANAKLVRATFLGDSWEGIVVLVPDPVPPAPKIIMFVADGEPRTYTTDAAPWRLDLSGQFGYLGAYDDQNNYRARAVQHYRQLPAEDTLTEEDLRMCRFWGREFNKGCDTYEKLRRIIVAMESKEKQC